MFFSWPGHAVVVVGLLSQPTEATLTVGESQVGGGLGESWVVYVSPTTYFSGTRKLKFDKLTQKNTMKMEHHEKTFPIHVPHPKNHGISKNHQEFQVP